MGEGTVRESGMDMDMLLLFYMENQQGPAAPLRELCSMSHSSLDGRGVWGEGIHVNIWLRPFAAP